LPHFGGSEPPQAAYDLFLLVQNPVRSFLGIASLASLRLTATLHAGGA